MGWVPCGEDEVSEDEDIWDGPSMESSVHISSPGA